LLLAIIQHNCLQCWILTPHS